MDEVFNDVMWGVLCKSCGGLAMAEDGCVALFFKKDAAEAMMAGMKHPEHPPELVCLHVRAVKGAEA